MTEDAEQAQAEDPGVCVWSLAFKAAGTSGGVRDHLRRVRSL